MQSLMLYESAAETVKNYMKDHSVQFTGTDEKIEQVRTKFLKKFSPEILETLSDKNLLGYIFSGLNENKNNLCHDLEYDSDIKKYFGSISGGNKTKLILNYQNGKWQKINKVLDESEALECGKEIRDYLVQGCNLISSLPLETPQDYERLDDSLMSLKGEYAKYGWVRKYFYMIFPDKFVGWYQDDWLKHYLFGFGIEPSQKYYVMTGQLVFIRSKTMYSAAHFDDICRSMFGNRKRFYHYRLKSSNEPTHYVQEWKEHKLIAIGPSGTESLENYLRKTGTFNKKKLEGVLSERVYYNDAGRVVRAASELKTFYTMDSNYDNILVITDGSKPISFVDHLGSYSYNGDSTMPHCRSGIWHGGFLADDLIPQEENPDLSFAEMKNSENLLYLYKKYYTEITSNGSDNKSQLFSVRFETGLIVDYPYNQIFFGAPGTGKSFQLNLQKEKLLENGGDYERITFHPDYTYANFVGTYKPVPCKDSDDKDAITYEYVPGPFMRVYVKALKNARAENPKPFLLIIEEINRANVAAVFGEVFQLLDRKGNGVSEYPIQASEDIKKYLSVALNADPAECEKIKIPDNMFIWATMNNADQGVFPMDTAFKRRWDFTYLGIDEWEKEIDKKYVLLANDHSQKVEWNKLRKAINNFLAKEKINEDKQLGPYFISREIVVPEDGVKIKWEKFVPVFENKVIMYLFEDAARQKRSQLFAGCAETGMRYSEICKAFEERGIGIFNQEIQHETNAEQEQEAVEDDAE